MNALVVGLLALIAPPVYAATAAPAITPTIVAVPTEAFQAMGNIIGSVTDAIFSILPWAIDHALPLFLLFLGIGVIWALFNRFRHGA